MRDQAPSARGEAPAVGDAPTQRFALDREGEREVELVRTNAARAATAGHITWTEAARIVDAAYDREQKRMTQEAILRGSY